MEFLLICGIILVALAVLVARIVRVLRRRAAPSCACCSCSLPQEQREQCLGAVSNDNNSSDKVC